MDKDQILVEEVLGKPARVDEEKGILYDCLLLGERSQNGRRYPATVREEALPLFEGAKVNLSHPLKRDKGAFVEPVPWDRRYGKAFEVRNATDGIRGNVRVLKKHSFTPTLMEAAVEMPEMFGFSPVMYGPTSQPDGEGIVDCLKIKLLKSIDLVCDPGTSKSLFEDIDMDKWLTEEEAPAQEAPKEEVKEEVKEELVEIDHELQTLIEQVTNELVDFHHDHKDAEQASSRIGAHLKHHAKMYLKGDKEEAKEEAPKEEAPKEEAKEEDVKWDLFLRKEQPQDKVILEDVKPTAPAKPKFEKVKSGYTGNFSQPQERDWSKYLRGA